MWGSRIKSALVGLIVLFRLILFANVVFSQGFIIPRPIPPFEPAMPKLTEHKVNVEINEQVARVKVDQVFYNDSRQPIEGTYYFPLPKEASVSDFKMIVDGKVLSGELLDKDKARQIYEDIVRRNIDPALLEYVDYNLFSARIFPIPPKKERKIVLEYSLLLKLDGDLVLFSYPLHGSIEPGRFAPPEPRPYRPPQPRPYPGPPYLIPLQQDGEEKNPTKDEKQSRRLTDIAQTIVVDLKSKTPLKNIYSPSHKVDVSRANDHHAKISYEGKRKDSADNFVLYYSLSQKDLGLSLLTYRPEENENGFFMLLISPKTEIAKDEIINKDIIFVLDVSGSMDGEKIKQAKAALRYCIENLDRNDRFNLISFSTESKLFKKRLVSASEFRNDAINYIDKLEAKGGTNINDALLDALKMKGDVKRPMSLVFITDGLPTLGETNIGNIINNITKENREKIRIFTFGVGYDVNTVLLDKLASQNQAVSDYIEPNEDIDKKISSFYDKISHPVLTDLEINYGKIDIEDVYPKKLPDLYKGSQLTVLGRFAEDKNTAITLTGKSKEQQNKFTYDADFSASKKENNLLPHLWATRKIGYLMDEIRLHGENKELKDEIIRLSKKYGVMSPYTSFLVQEELPVARSMDARPDVGSYRRSKMLNIDRNVTFGLEAHAPASAPMEQGIYAVKSSKAARAMKEQESGRSQASDFVKRIGDRTFYWQDSLWVDSEYKNEKTIDIKYRSPAYMDLIMAYRDVAKFMTLGARVIFRLQGKFVRIGEKGKEKFAKNELENLLR